jgi:protein-disulfide isomerase
LPISKSSNKKKGRSPKGAIDEVSPSLRIPVTLERDHIQGSFEATLTLVEYGDYQCPYCGAAYPEVKKVQRKLGSKLRFVFRNFPLTSMHEFAERAAEIAEASGARGKFWEMHDYLYEHQNLLGDPDAILEYARSLGLDADNIREEVGSHAYLGRIKEDFNGGVRSGVNGTPTFYINGTRYNGPPVANGLIEMLESLT